MSGCIPVAQTFSSSYALGAVNPDLLGAQARLGANTWAIPCLGVGLNLTRPDWQGGSFGGTKSGASLRKAQALEAIIAEVRNLGGDAPVKGDGSSDLPPKNSHEALLIRVAPRGFSQLKGQCMQHTG
eukprot:s1929_g15.t1